MIVFDSYSPAWAILGGFGLFLFGIRYLSETLQRVAGANFKRMLDRCVRNRFTSFVVGGTLTSLLQSETMAAIMVVTFINSGLLSLYQALAVLLGTTLGTTVAMQLVGVMATPVTFILILMGVAAKYFCRRRRMVATGELFLGIGFIFLGLGIMESGFSVITNQLAASGLLSKLDASPLIAFAAGTLITVVLQSGRATLVVIAMLANTQVLSAETAFAMLSGELLGAPIMANIAALLGTPMARQATGLFFGFNCCIAAVMFSFAPSILNLARSISTDITSQFIFAHALASLCGAALFVPLLGMLARLAASSSRQKGAALDIDPRPKFLDDRIMSTPGIALSQAREEVFRMATVSRSMLADFYALLYRYDSKKVTRVHQQEEVIDLLQRDITDYLARLAPNLADIQGRYEITRLLNAVNLLEQTGDSIAILLAVMGKKKELRIQFSPVAMNDLKMLIAALAELFDLMLTEWHAPAADMENAVKAQRTSLAQLHLDAMESHLERLAEGKCTVRGALIYNDILEASERIVDSIMKIYELNQAAGR